MERPGSRKGGGGDACVALAGEALCLPIRFLVEPKGKMTMTQGIHLVVPVSERDHRQGPATAAVTLVQYGDYECPYTRQSTTIVRAIQQQLGDQLRFVFRNFPLTEIHPHALWPNNALSPASRRMWKVANAVECKAPPRSSSMESCIAVLGNRMPCWLHSKQRAEQREALEVRSCGAERQSGGATHGEHQQHTARGTSGELASPPL